MDCVSMLVKKVSSLWIARIREYPHFKGFTDIRVQQIDRRSLTLSIFKRAAKLAAAVNKRSQQRRHTTTS